MDIDDVTTNSIINDKVTPNTYLNKQLYNDVPNSKKKKVKVKMDEFEVLEFGEQYKFDRINYNVQQLKIMCKFYKLKRSGNKKELIRRIYNFLSYSEYAVIIQKTFRMYLVKRFIKNQGPALYNRNDCVNDTDFYTLDSIHNIPLRQFISYRDEKGFVYGFDICSLYNLFKTSKHKTTNPYTREKFPNYLIRYMWDMIYIAKPLKYNVNIKIEKTLDTVSEEQRVILDITRVFQQIDALGNYTDQSWFLDLNVGQLIQYVKHLYDIWSYRAQLSNETKRNICHPTGNPFRFLPHLSRLVRRDLTFVRKSIIRVINELISTGIDDSCKNLGAYYSLASLTLVSQEAAIALPWLYESVSVQN